MDICKAHLAESDLLVQNSMDALDELIDASALPFFNSDRMIELGYESPGRKAIPIRDEDAHASYWVVCRASDQQKYRSILRADEQPLRGRDYAYVPICRHLSPYIDFCPNLVKR